MLKAVCGFCNREGAFVHQSFSWLPAIGDVRTRELAEEEGGRSTAKEKDCGGNPIQLWDWNMEIYWKAICSAYTDTVIPKESRANASWGDSQQSWDPSLIQESHSSTGHFALFLVSLHAIFLSTYPGS